MFPVVFKSVNIHSYKVMVLCLFELWQSRAKEIEDFRLVLIFQSADPSENNVIFLKDILGAFLPLIGRTVERDWGNGMQYKLAQTGIDQVINMLTCYILNHSTTEQPGAEHFWHVTVTPMRNSWGCCCVWITPEGSSDHMSVLYTFNKVGVSLPVR